MLHSYITRKASRVCVNNFLPTPLPKLYYFGINSESWSSFQVVQQTYIEKQSHIEEAANSQKDIIG